MWQGAQQLLATRQRVVVAGQESGEAHHDAGQTGTGHAPGQGTGVRGGTISVEWGGGMSYNWCHEEEGRRKASQYSVLLLIFW